ncbi:RPA family protein, a subunit of RPA complex in P.furiosus [Halalkaliarchaeum sp. AArc-CO]|uniref:RPA family protein n=1 Tax=Halalkaliarchaeum sp. AArc-CO TaxID=2866381 RepID=UPI00217F1DE9|nr:hypothetical protein [Halalkaliarchaeum sp. AArc-CO]UWG51205.1 RPA family protein, a subunit of RPA complex in P.furiosus [Halalkaliarchaeum sp. AArc-CO]
MSAEDGGSGGTGSGDGGPVGGGGREIAHRLFAAEFDDATLSYSESDEERAPNYVVTPTGARVNRLFAVGVLTEVEAVNEETSRGRIVDPTGAFVTYAGQYQPDEAAFLERADPPAFVALTGKARTFEPEDSDRVFTSVRPESLNAVDARTRDRWVVSTAEATLDRLAVFVRALESDLRGDRLREALAAGGASTALAAGIPKALATYDTSPAYVEAIRRTAVEALELVAGEREEVTRPSMAPAERGEVGISEVGTLPETDVTIADVDTETDAEPAAVNESAADAEAIDDDSAAPAESEDVAEIATEEPPTAEPESEPDPEVDPEPEPEEETESEPDETQAATDASAGGSESVEGTDIDASPDDDSESGDGMYELDEDERREVEDEYGTEFTTGTEVDDPGEADIDVPDADELAAELEADAGDEATDAEPAEEKPEPDTDGESEATDEVDPVDVDLESAAVDAIEAIDDGDGADREAVVARVVDEYGVDPDAVEDAIQDALMGGLCYEPGDDRLKAI